MKQSVLILSMLLLGSPWPAAATPEIQCDIGPVAKVFAKTDWLAYSCSDHTSLVFVAAPGNPASPYYFFLHRWNGRNQVQAEGNADRRITDAVNAQLQALSADQVVAIVAETVKAAATPKAN